MLNIEEEMRHAEECLEEAKRAIKRAFESVADNSPKHEVKRLKEELAKAQELNRELKSDNVRLCKEVAEKNERYEELIKVINDHIKENVILKEQLVGADHRAAIQEKEILRLNEENRVFKEREKKRVERINSSMIGKYRQKEQKHEIRPFKGFRIKEE